ncbi:uncharacterized protein [Amphiura filiformis]|uniref:uncharacterized protein n=1 Tax=Amphiura filiformis TaxID=82378 RepID=UPI003B215B36
MGLLHDSAARLMPLLYTFVDVCFALTIISDLGSADVICDRRNQTSPGVEELAMYCQNGGSCTLLGCHCDGGFYGTVCQHSVINAVIVVVVCILPPASWTMVFCYGCKERRRKRRLRQLRRQRQIERNASTDNLSPSFFADDLPPSYSEIAHNNPIALCGMDEEPYQSYTDGPPPPDYDDVLKKAIELGAILPLQATRHSLDIEATHSTYNEGVHQETPIDRVESSPSSVNDSLSSPPVTITTIDETMSTRSEGVMEDSRVQSSVILGDNPVHHSSREELIEDTQTDEYMGETNMGYSEAPNGSVRTLADRRPDSSHREPCTVEDTDSHTLSSVVVTDDNIMNTSQEDLIGADSDDEDC